MQNLDHAFCAANVEIGSYSDSSDNDDQLVVVVKLVVPRAAKVPAPVHQPETAWLRVRPASVSSTVFSTTPVELQMNNTARPTDWSTTATLKAAPLRPAQCTPEV
ncbi:hypothetical protein [Hymenobacter properus]|uniref:Uncharacterized protein n=1 Tax=Hymenobacter properus TaxID=2791026 RepID=A0A931BID2_9BACT|nr:hypothetical protein [Hymenobacter properus]MBF9140035.1 hypothetical protein [Hymenobacter properus]MBR7718842.1 hypothetical protein [Microvirga sp. SRT04]